MKLVFALGNPGSDYTGTRHNAGFFALDTYAGNHAVKFSEKSKYKCMIAELNINGEKILLAKPTTFYNLVGESYRSIIDFYKIAPEDTLLLHDELALPLGTIRARIGGSDAGNNGIKSINQHGGGQSRRVRIGIGSDQREVMGDTDFVLGKFSKPEAESIKELLPRVEDLLATFISDSFEATTHNG